MAKKLWEQLQEEEQEYFEQAKVNHQEAQEKFEKIASKSNNNKTSTIGSIQKAYKGHSNYNTVKNSMNNYYKNNKKSVNNNSSLWDRVQAIKNNSLETHQPSTIEERMKSYSNFQRVTEARNQNKQQVENGLQQRKQEQYLHRLPVQ